MSEKTQSEMQADKQINAQEESETTESPLEPSARTEGGPAPADEQAAKLETAEKQAKDYYDRLLRVSADFENYRKRTAREMRELTKYANEELMKELLPIIDNLERAVAVTAQESLPDDPLLKGVTLILAEIEKLFERHSVKPIEAMGKAFDPNYHQAMMQEESNDHPPNTVVRELQKGYTIHERLLRPAMVAVSKTDRAQDDSSET